MTPDEQDILDAKQRREAREAEARQREADATADWQRRQEEHEQLARQIAADMQAHRRRFLREPNEELPEGTPVEAVFRRLDKKAQDLRQRLAAHQARLATLEAQQGDRKAADELQLYQHGDLVMRDIGGRLEFFQRYIGPFNGVMGNDSGDHLKVVIAPGLAWAGKDSYEIPETSHSSAAQVPGSGMAYLYYVFTVNAVSCVLDTPWINHGIHWSSTVLAQSPEAFYQLIGIIHRDGTNFLWWEQRWFSDIYVPTFATCHNYGEGSTATLWKASLIQQYTESQGHEGD